MGPSEAQIITTVIDNTEIQVQGYHQFRVGIFLKVKFLVGRPLLAHLINSSKHQNSIYSE